MMTIDLCMLSCGRSLARFTRALDAVLPHLPRSTLEGPTHALVARTITNIPVVLPTWAPDTACSRGNTRAHYHDVSGYLLSADQRWLTALSLHGLPFAFCALFAVAVGCNHLSFYIFIHLPYLHCGIVVSDFSSCFRWCMPRTMTVVKFCC